VVKVTNHYSERLGPNDRGKMAGQKGLVGIGIRIDVDLVIDIRSTKDLTGAWDLYLVDIKA